MESDRCRLCAAHSLTRLPDIEPDTSSRINTLFQVQIGQTDDKLPRTICCHCLASVNAAWMFLERVHRAQSELLDCSLQKQLYEQRQEIPVEIPCIIQEQHFEQDDPNETWPDYPWNCRMCGETFADEPFYRRHPCFQNHRRYFCVDCPKVFKINYAKFVTHITEQHWDRYQNHTLLQCDVCQKWFHSKEAQEFHRDHEHPDAEIRVMPERPTSKTKITYECDLCGKTYSKRSNLDSHKRIHTGIKNFTCDQCGKSFSQKGNLAGHLLTHSTSRPFSCAVCDKTFKTLMRLRKHLDVHSGRKAHVCQVCGRDFRERGTLRAHVRIHTGAMPYCCDYCGKSFRFKGVLTTHRRQHTGERPYSCLECQHHFTNWPNYNKHMMRRHNINTSTVYPRRKTQRNPPPNNNNTVLTAQPIHIQQVDILHHHQHHQQQQHVDIDLQQHQQQMIDDVNLHINQQTFPMMEHHQQEMIEHQSMDQYATTLEDHHVAMMQQQQQHHEQQQQHYATTDNLVPQHHHHHHIVHMPTDMGNDMGGPEGGVLYQTAPAVIGGYYTTYELQGGITHVVTQ